MPDKSDAVTALQRAQSNEFSRQPLFNASELKLYRQLSAMVGELEPTAIVFGQLALAEFIKTDSKFKKGGGYYAVANRRVDFAFVSANGDVVAAIEYHGGGHKGAGSDQRDEIKATILEKAGVPLLVIEENTPESEIRRRVAAVLGKSP